MSIEGKSAEEVEALAALADSMASDPKTRGAFLRMTKQLNPTASIPEIDTFDRVGAALKPHLDKIATLEKQANERDLKDRVIAQRREALSVPGVSRADLTDIEKLMVEKRIPDHKTAAEHFAMSKKLAEPTSASLPGATRTFGAPKSPDLKAFGGDIKNWARSEAAAAVDELRGRRAA